MARGDADKSCEYEPNQNKKLKTLKRSVELKESAESDMTFCRYVTMRDSFRITHSHLVQCEYENIDTRLMIGKS